MESAHGGDAFERLLRDGVLVLQLHNFDVEHDHGRIGDPSSRSYGNGLALWFEIDDFDEAVSRAEGQHAEVVLPPHRNPRDDPGGPDHREVWPRDPDRYLVVLASLDGESPWPDPRVPGQPAATSAAPASATTPPTRRGRLSLSASTMRARTIVTTG